MNAEFKFALGSSVSTPAGILGTVEGNFISKNSKVNRVLVGYSTKDGRYIEDWIDEDKLVGVE